MKIPAGGKGKCEAAIVIDSDSEDSGKMFKVAAVLAIGLNYGVRKNVRSLLEGDLPCSYLKPNFSLRMRHFTSYLTLQPYVPVLLRR